MLPLRWCGGGGGPPVDRCTDPVGRRGRAGDDRPVGEAHDDPSRGDEVGITLSSLILGAVAQGTVAVALAVQALQDHEANRIIREFPEAGIQVLNRRMAQGQQIQRNLSNADAAIGQIDWPKERLDAVLLLEEDDAESLRAIDRLTLPSFFRVIMVPASAPKTKPKA